VPSTFRPYSREELRQAAESYGIDPAFVEAVYSVESSDGNDPNAMRARSVKRKRDRTIVRGPFQLEDDTVADLIRKHKLGSVNVDDPDTHLDLALRQMAELRDRYAGDYRKMAQAYLGGPGGVTNPNAKDELGTSTGVYGNKILAKMNEISGGTDVSAPMGGGAPFDIPGLILSAPRSEDSPFMHGASAGGDIFGIPAGFEDNPLMIGGGGGFNDNPLLVGGGVSMGIPEELGGDMPLMQTANSDDTDQYLARMTDEVFRDIVNA